MKSDILTQASGRDDLVVVRFKVFYSGLNYLTEEYPALFSKSSTIKFKWDSHSGRFVFDPSASEKSKEEFESIYQLESRSVGSFLKYSFTDLMRIAKGNDKKLKSWLRDFLDECDNTPEKIALIEALG